MGINNEDAQSESTRIPTQFEAFKVWLKIGLLSFGGPAAQIALMHWELVDQRKWLSERQFLNALSFCMLLPGPEAMQLATYAGWRLHRFAGGLIAGLLFFLPGALVIFLLGLLYVYFGEIAVVNYLFIGIKATVIVIVIEALLKVSKRALTHRRYWVVAGIAFIGIFFFAVPFPVIVISAAIFGYWQSSSYQTDLKVEKPDVSFSKTILTILIWLVVWWIPLLLLVGLTGNEFYADVAHFFSRLAVVTFGGAYAVLAYLGQDVVVGFGWLTAGEMMDGLGLAETTPGPLILVNEFVGFLAGFRQGGLESAVIATLVTLWATFVPCFMWIFVGAPYVDWMSNQPRLTGALTSITAAVVGVILNLSIWFALHVLFSDVSRQEIGPLVLWNPDISSIQWIVLSLTCLSAILLLRLHWGITRVLLVSGLLAIFISSGQNL
jgi:chromate transporter